MSPRADRHRACRGRPRTQPSPRARRCGSGRRGAAVHSVKRHDARSARLDGVCWSRRTCSAANAYPRLAVGFGDVTVYRYVAEAVGPRPLSPVRTAGRKAFLISDGAPIGRIAADNS
ncbi:hypothetical protein SCATT_42780 [Streptantibioticus cattleyicolor NRRL 8057 = DSM 46488]|uniref:Uncharacterized protein n=1 Tax=Streptantibioticus cattleyicolor (strain ATCC 35852 / DSM 46488 / JCM 4925 / NBRC 14057 / NRRL 8057) TaxID=1003195 RepID=G8WSU3_STREN|nr:hypothetical protein SCATT_42780 [Streptantibioticus cattleyicolor NRRL 8057 = DSM 46488]